MMLKKILQATILVMLIAPCKLSAQQNQFSGWGAIFHTQKFSDKWGISFDGQFRSANHFDYLRNILLRPSVNYYFDGNKMAALGYAYVITNGRTLNGASTFRPESRTWEQLIINQKLGKGAMLQHRLRLEQRFLGNTADGANDSYFAQRFRYFARAVVPFNGDKIFKQGPFIGLQNEIFFNVQNKDKVNRHFFDQNRAYAALGYRVSPKFDVETGYMNQYTKQAATHTVNHILQVALYTRF